MVARHYYQEAVADTACFPLDKHYKRLVEQDRALLQVAEGNHRDSQVVMDKVDSHPVVVDILQDSQVVVGKLLDNQVVAGKELIVPDMLVAYLVILGMEVVAADRELVVLGHHKAGEVLQEHLVLVGRQANKVAVDPLVNQLVACSLDYKLVVYLPILVLDLLP